MSKGPYANENSVSAADHRVEEVPHEIIVRRFGTIGPHLSKLFNSGVEARGIERVPENQREKKNFWNKSVNMLSETVSVGILAQYFFSLSLPHAVATTLCFTALGCIPTAVVSTLGPQTGLRTMIIVRYSSGYLGGIFFSFLNVLTQFTVVTTSVVLGGEALVSINPNTLPLVAGIVIIAVCSLIPCFIGYHMVHQYERYAWIVTFFIMCCLYGLGGAAGYNLNTQKPSENTGRALSTDILGFGAILFDVVASWAPVAADYNVYLPADTNPWHVFIMTFWGFYLPTVFIVMLGVALMTTDAALAYDGDTNALFAHVLSPWGGGGKFLLVLLTFSAISSNITNTYSVALSIQALGRPFAMVPRFLWVIFVFVVYTIVGVVGQSNFSDILGNFLSISNYWIAFFVVIVVEEHCLFRQKGGKLGGYNLADYGSPDKLPIGIAALLASCFGIAGAVVGMSQEWYTGPIATMGGVRTCGADLGYELATVFAAVTFPPLRWMEIRLTGR